MFTIPMRISTVLAYATSAVWFSLVAMPVTPRDQILGQPWSAHALVVGAPGSGKTALLTERLVDVVGQGVRADDVFLVTPQRSQASLLRDRVALTLGHTTSGPRVRSIASFAFALVSSAHRDQGLPPPDVLSASQIDTDIHALLVGHIEDGSGPRWPDPLTSDVRMSLSFRGELREFMARMIEHGLSSEELRHLAIEHSRPAWSAVADFFDEFERIVSSVRPGAFDSAGIIRRASLLVSEGLPGSFASLRHVCLDDAHDLTSPGLELARSIGRHGVGITVAAEPDTASNTFRGSDPRGVAELGAVWGVTPVVLPEVYRHGEPLRSLVAEVTQRTGTAGFGTQRRSPATPGSATTVETVLAPSDQREARDISRIIMTAHRDDGIPWERIAVIARRGSQVSRLVRELGVSGIPARASVAGSPVRDQPAAKELLELVAMGRGLIPLTPAGAISLLSGRYGQVSPQDLRRLRFRLRLLQDPELPYRSADVLVLEELQHRGGFVTLETSAAARAHLMAEILDDIRAMPPTTPVTEVLWTVLERTGVLPGWVHQAGDPGLSQAGAHRALDSLVALFAQAHSYVEAHPGGSLELFLESVLNAAVPEDVVMPEPAWPSVTVATPARVAGREFDLVVIAGVNESVWPDLRLRDSLLGAHRAIQTASGFDLRGHDERRGVLEDELRLFALALSRARRRVVVTAVESEETAPSPLFRLASRCGVELLSETSPPPTIRSLVAKLRGDILSALERGEEPSPAIQDLAYAAHRGAPGAHPDTWWGLLAPSSTEPLFEEGDVPISPSALATLEESPLEWFLDQVAGGESTSERGLGLLLHHALEERPDGSGDELWGLVENRFGQLEYDAGWIEEFHRRLARAMVDALAEYLEDRRADGSSLLASEASFQIRHGRAVVRGVIDRIERSRDGGILVVDLKTGQFSTDSQVVDNPQMLAYQLGVHTEELMEQCGITDPQLEGAALLFVKSGVRGKRYRLALQQPLDQDMTNSVLERIDRACEIIASAEFSGEPRNFGAPGAPSRHRWHFVGQVCGDD